MPQSEVLQHFCSDNGDIKKMSSNQHGIIFYGRCSSSVFPKLYNRHLVKVANSSCHCVVFYSNDKRDLLFLKKTKPFFSYKLSIGKESLNPARTYFFENFSQNFFSNICMRASAIRRERPM